MRGACSGQRGPVLDVRGREDPAVVCKTCLHSETHPVVLIALCWNVSYTAYTHGGALRP